VVRENHLAGDAAAFVPDEILLAVEVLSPSGRSYDQITKRYHYARMGVPQYWIVNPVERQMSVMLLDGDGKYRDVATVDADERWKTDDPFPIELDPAEFC
jgi:Uma2 family endonuclease